MKTDQLWHDVVCLDEERLIELLEDVPPFNNRFDAMRILCIEPVEETKTWTLPHVCRSCDLCGRWGMSTASSSRCTHVRILADFSGGKERDVRAWVVDTVRLTKLLPQTTDCPDLVFYEGVQCVFICEEDSARHRALRVLFFWDHRSNWAEEEDSK